MLLISKRRVRNILKDIKNKDAKHTRLNALSQVDQDFIYLILSALSNNKEVKLNGN